MRVWIPKEGQCSWAVENQKPHDWFTDEQLVDFFLEITKSWYEDPQNLLFGWRDRVRVELLRCLETGDDANEPHQLIYAEMKFSQEWTGPNGMFTVMDEGPLTIKEN